MSSDKDTRDIISYLNRTLPIYRLKDFEKRLDHDLPFREKYEMQRKLHEIFDLMPLDELKKKDQEAIRLANEDLISTIRIADNKEGEEPANPTTTSLPTSDNSNINGTKEVKSVVLPLWKKKMFRWAVAAAILIGIGIGLLRSRNENQIPHHISEADKEKEKNKVEQPVIHESLKDQDKKEYVNTPSRPDLTPNSDIPLTEDKKKKEEGVIAEKNDTEKEPPSTGLPERTNHANFNTILITYRQSNRAGGVGALPEGGSHAPAFVQDSVKWKLDIHKLSNTNLRRHLVGHYELDKTRKTLSLHLNDKGYLLLENTQQITLEQQSDRKLSLLSGTKPVLILFGDGSVEIAL